MPWKPIASLWQSFQKRSLRKKGNRILLELPTIPVFNAFFQKWTGHALLVFDVESIRIYRWRSGYSSDWRVGDEVEFRKHMGDEVWNVLRITAKNLGEEVFDVAAYIMDSHGERETSVHPDCVNLFIAETHKGYVPLFSQGLNWRSRPF